MDLWMKRAYVYFQRTRPPRPNVDRECHDYDDACDSFARAPSSQKLPVSISCNPFSQERVAALASSYYQHRFIFNWSQSCPVEFSNSFSWALNIAEERTGSIASRANCALTRRVDSDLPRCFDRLSRRVHVASVQRKLNNGGSAVAVGLCDHRKERVARTKKRADPCPAPSFKTTILLLEVFKSLFFFVHIADCLSNSNGLSCTWCDGVECVPSVGNASCLGALCCCVNVNGFNLLQHGIPGALWCTFTVCRHAKLNNIVPRSFSNSFIYFFYFSGNGRATNLYNDACCLEGL